MPERYSEYVYQLPAKFTEEVRQRINNAGFSDEFKQQLKSAQKQKKRCLVNGHKSLGRGGLK